MPNCAVLSCKNYTKKVGRDNGNVSFHRFPSDPKVKEQWIEATGQKIWFPTQYSRICSVHFNEGSFTETKKFRRLTTNAIPTIDVLKTLTSGVKIIDQNLKAHEPSPCSTSKRKLEKDIHQPSTSNEESSLISPEKRKLVHKLNLAQQTIVQKNKQIKRLREQNRRKSLKIHTLVSLLERLKNKSFINEEQANLLNTTNITTKELYSRQMANANLK